MNGESGPGARPVMQEWVTDIRDQCLRAEVPFFFKQWGSVQKTRSGRAARLALTGEAVSKGRRSHVGRDASHHEFGEGINEKPALEWTGFLLHSLADFQTPNLVGCDRRECRNPAKGGRFGTSTGSVHASFTEI